MPCRPQQAASRSTRARAAAGGSSPVMAAAGGAKGKALISVSDKTGLADLAKVGRVACDSWSVGGYAGCARRRTLLCPARMHGGGCRARPPASPPPPHAPAHAGPGGAGLRAGVHGRVGGGHRGGGRAVQEGGGADRLSRDARRWVGGRWVEGAGTGGRVGERRPHAPKSSSSQASAGAGAAHVRACAGAGGPRSADLVADGEHRQAAQAAQHVGGQVAAGWGGGWGRVGGGTGEGSVWAVDDGRRTIAAHASAPHLPTHNPAAHNLVSRVERQVVAAAQAQVRQLLRARQVLHTRRVRGAGQGGVVGPRCHSASRDSRQGQQRRRLCPVPAAGAPPASPAPALAWGSAQQRAQRRSRCCRRER